MLRRSIEAGDKSGARRLRAETDSDVPWTLYTYAELPFQRDARSVALTLVPPWQS